MEETRGSRSKPKRELDDEVNFALGGSEFGETPAKQGGASPDRKAQ